MNQLEDPNTEGKINWQSNWSAIGLWGVMYFFVLPGLAILFLIALQGATPSPTVTVLYNLIVYSVVSYILYRVNKKALMLFLITAVISFLISIFVLPDLLPVLLQ